MGDPKKADRKFVTPSHPWEAGRIQDENKLLNEYGLKNKREIWGAEYEISNYRRQARELISSTGEKAEKRKAELTGKLAKFGILEKDGKLDDMLGLEVRDLLERRIQTLVLKKGIANSPREARQLIIHGHVAFKGEKVMAPSLIVQKDSEKDISYVGPPRIPPEKRVPKKTQAKPLASQGTAEEKPVEEKPEKKAEEQKAEEKPAEKPKEEKTGEKKE